MKTLASACTFCEEIKNSRFIAHACNCEEPAAAMAFLSQASDSDATHNCWAYRFGDQYRSHDDGEPSGTAGRPILAAIEGHDLDNIIVLVTRFFGGKKLGAGGLVRAYGGCASKCLDRAKIVEVHPRCMLEIFCPFDHIGQLHHILKRYTATKLEEKYNSDGLRLLIEITASEYQDFSHALADASRAEIQVGQPKN